MRFNVQSITKIIDTESHEPRISHFEIDLVDDQMNSNYQSSITLRIEPKDIGNYFIGQMFTLSTNPKHEADRNVRAMKYHELNFASTEIFDEE